MASAEDLLEELLEGQLALVRAKKGSAREAQLEERIAKLETQLAGKPAPEVEEAAEELELDDEELAWVREQIAERRKGTTTIPDGEAKPDTDDGAAGGDAPATRTRPGRKSGQLYKWTVGEDGRVQELDIPTVYNGTDEDDQVELPADEADAA